MADLIRTTYRCSDSAIIEGAGDRTVFVDETIISGAVDILETRYVGRELTEDQTHGTIEITSYLLHHAGADVYKTKDHNITVTLAADTEGRLENLATELRLPHLSLAPKGARSDVTMMGSAPEVNH